ncbi:hypothetical protein LZB47_08245, partial [Campylobacter lari]
NIALALGARPASDNDTLRFSAMSATHASLAAALRSPVTSADDVETLDAFFKRPEVRAFYEDAQDPAHTDAGLRFCAE